MHVRRQMTSSVLPYLYDYIKQTGISFFFPLRRQKKKYLEWMSVISWREVRPPASEQLGSGMTAHALTMHALRRREVNEHASTDDPWLCVAGDGKSVRSFWDSTSQGSEVITFHQNVATVQFCHWANSMGHVYTHKAFLHKEEEEQPWLFQGSDTHSDWESRSTCNISSQWKQHRHSKRLSWYTNESLFGLDRAEGV